MSFARPHILLITEDEGLRQAVLNMPEYRVFTFECAVDNVAAIRKVERAEISYNILVIDYTGPATATEVATQKTVESLRSIKSLCPSVDVIVLTNGDRQLGIDALKAGALDYIDKSVLNSELPFRIEQLLENQRLREIVESLHDAIISITAKEDRDELLETITKEAMKLVKARDCGIYAYYPEREELIVITDFRHPEFRGKKLRVGQGGAGSLVASGKPYLIIQNWGESQYKTEVYENKAFASVLEVRLMSQQETVGVLYVDDVIGRTYTDHDVQLLRLFADCAAIALRHIEHEERLERLIDSSPLGIIEVKRGGPEIKGHDAIVTRFNKAAEDILEYDENEAVGKLVSKFYTDPEEPKKIGDLLWRNNGRLSDHFTQVRTKEGKNVPIRHAATWVFDSAGRRNGSVGFFEDLSPIEEREREFEILLNASNLIATADNITAGLKGLAELLVNRVGGTFGRILLFDEAEDALVPKAAHRIDGSTWNPAIDQVAYIKDWPLLRRVLHEKRPVVRRCGDPEEQFYLKKLAGRLQLGGSIQSLLIVPLTVDETVIGLLQVGEEREEGGTTFDDIAIELAAAIGAQTAVLISRERARLRFESLFKASTALVSPDDPEQVLIDVVESAREAAGASSMSFVQIDEHGRAINLTTAGIDFFPDIATMIRPDGNSMKVWESGSPILIENTAARESNFNPAMKRGIKVGAAVCIPISIQGSRLGVMWVHYREPRRFREYEIERLQLCVNQAALAYDSSRRISELKRIREAAKTLATATTQHEVLKEIVASACKALLADSAVIWFYVGQSFVSELSQSHGIPGNVWQEFRSKGPREHGTARKVIEQGVLEIADVTDSYDLGERTQLLLKRVDARRFLGIALRVGNDILGVLYVNYKQPRSFRPEEREMILSFANQAAFALKRSRLHEQLERTRRTATSIAEVSTLGALTPALDLVTAGTKEALGCDAVTIYVYDPEKHCLNCPPSMIGVWHPERTHRFETVPLTSLVLQVLNSKEILTVPDISTDDLFKESRFAAEEEIKSCAGVPLRVGEELVGVMFVSYRKAHVFSGFETANIKLFSSQAAIAIHNAKLFDRTKKDLKDREEFLELSSQLLGTLNLQETMNCATRFAAKAFDEEFCSLVLPHDDRRILLRSGVGWPQELIGNRYVGKGNKSQSGYTIEKGDAILVDDLDKETRFGVPDIVFEYKLKSVLSVPVVIDENVTGVLLVYSKRSRRFGRADIPRLQLIANQTAIAIRSAQHHESTERARADVQLLYDTSKTSTTATWGAEREKILGEIVRRAVEHFKPQAVLGTIHTYDEETDELTLVIAHPPGRLDSLIEKLGKVRPLDGNEKTGYRKGIIGRTVETGEAQIAFNEDPDYVVLDPTTRAELAVPLKENSKVIGVLNIESDKKGAFGLDDQKTIEALAELALMVISLARQYKTVAARTALVFMGLSSNNWYHGLRNKAISIRNNAGLLKKYLGPLASSNLEQIYEAAQSIIDFPRLEALSREVGTCPLQVNAHLKERVSQLKRSGFFKKVPCRLELGLENNILVKANPTWLNEVLNVLLDNALDAMKHSKQMVLTIETVKDGRKVAIKFSDTGSGIPDEIRTKIFEEPVAREFKKEGWGWGLLMASFIVQVYGGDIAIGTTGPGGTTMIVRLPIYEPSPE